MNNKLKKILGFLNSRIMRVTGIAVALLLTLAVLYSVIPLPDITDGYLPDEVRKISYSAPFTIRFSQPMDKKSVEENFSVTPNLKGEFVWKDSKTLEFTSEKTLEIDDEYKVIIASGARNIYYKSLSADYTLQFVVSGPPYVKFISPYLGTIQEKADETSDKTTVTDTGEEVVGFVEGAAVKAETGPLVIESDQVVTVMFDRPMRALTTLDESEASQDFPDLQITPSVKGSYRWVGTTAFQFIPDGWEMGTTYTLKLPKGIIALDDSETEDEIEWELVTEEPKVISSDPFEADDAFSVNGEIALTFNQEMDLDFIRPGDNVLLYPSNDVDADKNTREDGFFNTEVVFYKDKDGKTDKNTLVFKPEFPYLYDQDYKFVVKAGLKGSAAKVTGYGDRTMSEDFTLNFTTLKKPDIVSFLPANGDRNYQNSYIEIEFSSPITKELIEDNLELDPEPSEEPEIYVYRVTDQTTGSVWTARIDYGLEASTEYTFKFKAPFKDSSGNTSAKGFSTSFKTAPKTPYLSLLTSTGFGLFMDGLGPVYPIKSVNIKNIDIEVCNLSEQEFFSINENYSWYTYSCSDPLSKTVDVKGKLDETYLMDLDLADSLDMDFDHGIYFFRMSSKQYVDYEGKPYVFYQSFFITDTNLTLKKSGEDLLVWATDLKTGLPVSRMDISILGQSGKERKKGVTDGNGIYKITEDFDDSLFVVGTKTLEGENRWSMVGQYWDDGIQSWQYNFNGEWVSMNEPRVYLYTERPLYRPGDDVLFKGIYRIDKDLDLSMPTDKKVRVVIEDPEYNEITSKEVTVLSDGSFNGTFTLGDEARLGRYNLYAEAIEQKSQQRFYDYFFVEEYKKPKFKVEALSQETEYSLGDEISVDLAANYYFGGAIKEGQVSWTMMQEPYFFDKYKGEGYYSFGTFLGFYCFWTRCESETEIIDQGEGTLDQNGRFKLKVKTGEKTKPGRSYLYTINATVKDQDGETVNKRESFIVHQGSYYIGLSLRNYIVSQEDDLTINVITVDSESEAVADKKITLELYREKWNTVKKQGVDGSFYDESVRELVYTGKESVTTETDPVEVMFKIGSDMEGGQYVIQAKGSDSSNEILSEISFYVSSYSWFSWGSSNNNRMELEPDQPEYYVGGKARLMIKSPYGTKDEPVKALVTYERGNIQHYEVIDIKSNSDVIEIPIAEDMAPNVYVTVLVAKGAGENFDKFIAGDKGTLETKKSSLESDIKAIEDEIKDMEDQDTDSKSTRNAILVSKKNRELEDLKEDLKDVTGKLDSLKDDNSETGIEALDFSLIKPDFKFGIANLIVSKREHRIEIDLKTSKDDYTIGDTVEIEIHTRDYQNRPVSSMVSLAVVDESLLALKANTNESPLDYFYGQRALQVSTATSLTMQVNRVNVSSQNGAKGGDGGLAEGFDKKRGEFKDTAYFNPLIKTDDGGYAKVTFEPPDNLTIWEVWAVAYSGEDKFGMDNEEFVVKKPVAVTSILPRFVISGDQLTIGALIHNQSGKDVKTRIELSAPGLTINGNNKKSISVKDGETGMAEWEVTVNPVDSDSVLTVDFSAYAADSLKDAVQYKLPVKTFAFPEIVSTNGAVETTYTENIRIPDTVVSGMGYLDVRAGGSLVTKLIKQFKALEDYPYGCAEQITSQILPTLVLKHQAAKLEDADLFKLLGLDEAESDKIIEGTLQKLSKFQLFDGGYGFWEGAYKGNPILTSYVLYAQYLARNSGFTVSDNNYNLAIQYLWKLLNGNDPYDQLRGNERAFVLWVLSEAGQNDTGMTLSLYEKRYELSVYAHALLLMNLENLYNSGQKSVRTYMERLKSELASYQISDDRTVHFEEEGSSFWDLNTDRRTTAMALMALNRDNPENPLLPKIIDYLSTSETNKNFINSQETAWMLMAMLEYAESQDVLTADFDFSVKLNHEKVMDGEITSSNLAEVFEKRILMESLKTSPDVNTLDLQKDGEGEMSYDMELKYYLPNETIKPMEKGFQITRDYYEFDTGEKGKTVTAFQSGDIYRGELNIIVPEDMYYVVVEERLPAGFEAINFNLDTADTSLQYKLDEETKTEDADSYGYYWYDNPLWYFNHRETGDENVLLFADYLPKGVYTYSFLVRAGLPGKYHHLPASAYQMYYPEVFGRTEGEFVEIK